MPKLTARIGEKWLESCCILIRIAKPPEPAMRLIAIWLGQDGSQTTAIVTCFVAGRPNSENFERFDRLALFPLLPAVNLVGMDLRALGENRPPSPAPGAPPRRSSLIFRTRNPE